MTKPPASRLGTCSGCDKAKTTMMPYHQCGTYDLCICCRNNGQEETTSN